MAKFLSGRQRNLSIGINSFTENSTVLEVTGNVGIGTTDSEGKSLYVIGDGQFDGNLKVTGIATFGTGTIIVDGNNNIITVGTGVTISSIDGIDAPSIRVDTLNTDNLFVTGITTLASNGGITTTGGNLYVGQNLEVTGNSNFIGNVELRGGNILIGDFITDTINVGGEFISNLNPSNDGIYDLGNDEKRWRNVRLSGLTETADLYVSGIGTIATLDTTNGTIDYLSGTNVYYSGISTFGITNITVNSSSNALTIDQNGIGNALVVQPDINGFVVTGIGSVGVGVANPGEALQVSGNIRIGSSDSNYIAFRGTTGDILNGGFNHTFIGERIYTPGTEESELFIFKGNDHDLSIEGPDRIRLGTAEFRIDTYTTATWGAFEDVATSPNLSTKFIVRDNGFVGVGTANPLTTLDVNGGFNVSGVGTIATLDTTTGTIDYLSGTNISYSGIGTIGTLDTTTGTIDYLSNTNLNTSGIGTIETLDTTTGIIDYLSGANLSYSGIGTIETLDVTTGTIDYLSGTNVSYSGIGTIETLDTTVGTIDFLSGTNVSYSGIGTIETLDTTVGTIDYLSGTNVSYSGIATLGIATISELYVSGVSTFVGVGTFSGDLYVGGDLYVADDIVFDELNARNINVTGIGTVETLDVTTGTIDYLTNTNLNNVGIATLGIVTSSQLYVSGVVTATTFYGNLNGNASTATYATNAGVATYADSAGVSTSVIGGIASVTQLNVTGVSTFGGNVYFGDNDVLNFGDANDLQIYHNGSNSYIDDTGTGNLIIGVANFQIMNVAHTENYITATNNGAVELYYDAVKKFETTSSGIKVQPSSSSSGIVEIQTGTINSDSIRFQAGGTVNTYLEYRGYLGHAWFVDTAEVVRFNSTGVGIGVTNPSQKLTVSNNILLGASVSGGTATPSYIDLGTNFSNGSTRDKLKIYLYNSGIEQYGFGVGGIGDIQYHSNAYHDFYIGNNSAVRINSNRNLLVGSQTETGTASQPLQVTGGAYISGNVGINSTAPTSKLDVDGDVKVSGVVTSTDYNTPYTKNGSVTFTTNTTIATGIHSTLSATVYRSVEYTIQATEGTNFHASKILVIHNGTDAYLTEYGTIFNNSSVASFDVDISGGNIRLLSTAFSSNSTNYVIHFVATKL